MEEAIRLRKQLTRTRVMLFISILFSIMCLIYGIVHRNEADEQYANADHQRKIAQQAMAEAQRQEAMAVQARAEADRQRMLSEESAALVAAKNQKKNK